jgi:hypothetical protein
VAFSTIRELQVRAAGFEGFGCQLCELGMELLLELSQSRIEGAVSRFELSVILTSGCSGTSANVLLVHKDFVLQRIQLGESTA